MSKSYRGSPVLNGITLSLPSQGLHLIQGENGRGKTTLFKCLAALEHFNGSITWNDRHPRQAIAAAFDDSSIHPALSGLKNLSVLLDRSPKSLQADQGTVRFLSVGVLKNSAKGYSMGQRKKLKLTAALMSHRQCILLDEPLAGLDKLGRQKLWEALKSAARQKCIIVADHETDFYRELNPTTFEIDNGLLLSVPEPLSEGITA
ncbi:ATP-binding cassette domain-containing protein [Paenarthrobacter sp. NPDC058040]|uniref:ABC transporter ATP-binding protein n=1 Tax=unclassified Paenarthrobacter TaxID=2634190 RepID=UPI0036D82405